jgi:hypothetical protein
MRDRLESGQPHGTLNDSNSGLILTMPHGKDSPKVDNLSVTSEYCNGLRWVACYPEQRFAAKKVDTQQSSRALDRNP